MAPVIGAASCEKLMERIPPIEATKNVKDLRPLLQRA
jgi:hypothetical protein